MPYPLSRLTIGLLVLLPVALLGARIEPRKFTILGNQVITRQVAPNGATAEENEFIKIEVTGLITSLVNGGDSTVTRTFGFSLKQPVQLRRVRVEDVTGAEAEVLVTDEAPVVTKAYWKGDAETWVIGRETSAWLYAPGDDWRVFRFTISTDRGEMIFLQPSVIMASSKVLYLEAAQKAAQEPSQEHLQKLLDVAGKLLPKDSQALLLPIMRPPAAGDMGLFDALKQARKRKLTVAVASDQADWALAVIRAALGKAKKGQFKDQVMVVVAPGVDAAAFTPLATVSGLKILVGSTTD